MSGVGALADEKYISLTTSFEPSLGSSRSRPPMSRSLTPKLV
jgi:hypothetical protein